MIKKKNSRVLVGPVEVAGHYRKICLALKAVGVNADLVIYRPNPAEYGDIQRPPGLIRIGRALSSGGESSSHNSMLMALQLFASYLFFSMWGIKAIFKYDTFIFGFGHSLFPFNLDLPILRALRKRVIANLYHGSEIRPPFTNGALHQGHSEAGTTLPAKFFVRRARRLKYRAAYFERYATTIIGAPLTSSPYLEKKFVNIFAIGIPTQVTALGTARLPKGKGPIVVLHAPSNPAAKGTPEIREIINGLNAKGLNLRLVELSGRPNAEILAAIADCDFVVDQMYSDIPFPTFTIEAGAAGKASVVGGYGLAAFGQFLPDCSQSLVENCDPDDVSNSIEKLALDLAHRERLGTNFHAFLESNWSLHSVGSRLTKVLAGEIPAAWWIQPKSISYAWGCAQSKTTTLRIVQKLVQRYGWAPLQLGSRPEIREQLSREIRQLANFTAL